MRSGSIFPRQKNQTRIINSHPLHFISFQSSSSSFHFAQSRPLYCDPNRFSTIDLCIALSIFTRPRASVIPIGFPIDGDRCRNLIIFDRGKSMSGSVFWMRFRRSFSILLDSILRIVFASSGFAYLKGFSSCCEDFETETEKFVWFGFWDLRFLLVVYYEFQRFEDEFEEK